METVDGKECRATGSGGPEFVGYPNRKTRLGELEIWRALPIRERRLVGPWCFLDRFGPLSFRHGQPMNVPPHPHIGLQTVSWLLEGEILHTDSLGSQAIVRPGGVNVMTAGRGISHTEETPATHSGRLSGVQLWVALPDSARDSAPSFVHLPEAPVVEIPGGQAQVFAGSFNGTLSPTPHYSEIIGVQVDLRAGEPGELPLDPGYEHAVLLLSGDCTLAGAPLAEGTLYTLGSNRSSLALHSQTGGQVLLIGGPPFPETILMWWNFVARTPEELAQARADWENHLRFGEVPGEHGQRLAAPDLLRFARPNPAS
jgi:hypothetical protein